MKHKIITCASYGGTGSSAITDIFKEFKNVKSTDDFEVSILHEMDGVSDLEYHLSDNFHRLKSDEAIYRFKSLSSRLSKEYNEIFSGQFSNITDKYIEDLVDEKWQGFWHQHVFRKSKYNNFFNYYIPLKLQFIKNRIFKSKHGYEFVPNNKRQIMYLAYCKDTFVLKTQKYLENLFTTLDYENNYEYLFMDQLVPPTNIDRYNRYFKNIKVVVVDRDPRDLYILNKLYWKEGWIPSDDINIFVNWFKMIRKDNKKNEENVLRINFEELILDYEGTLNKLLDFTGMDKINHTNKFKYFNPEISKKNFRLWKDEEKIKGIENDIKFIETNLKEFIINN